MAWAELFPFMAVAFAVGSFVGRRELLGPGLPRLRRDSRWFVVAWSFWMAATTGLMGLFLFLRGVSFLDAPQLGPSGAMMVAGSILLLAGGVFAWVGVAVGRHAGVAERLARAAKAAWREFHATTGVEAKPKVDPTARLLD